YRFTKFARRNKVALTTVALVAASLVTGVVISTWQAVRATKAETLAEQRLVDEAKARREAEESQKVATANFDRAHGAVNRMLTPVADEELAGLAARGPVRNALLEDALEFYEQLLAERSTDPEIRLATAQAHCRL